MEIRRIESVIPETSLSLSFPRLNINLIKTSILVYNSFPKFVLDNDVIPIY